MGYIAIVSIVAAAVLLAVFVLWLCHIDDSGQVHTQPLSRQFYRYACLAVTASSLVTILATGFGREWAAYTIFMSAIVILIHQLDRSRSWYYAHFQEPLGTVIRTFTRAGMPDGQTVTAAGPEDDPGWATWAKNYHAR